MLKTVSSITNAIGALNYKGTWNASTNSPTLASGVGTKGDYYVVSVAGATALDGISNWGVGDWAAYNGSTWQRVEGGANLNGVDLSVSGTSTLSGLTASTALALDASKNIVSVTNTGTGNNVLASSPSIATPTLTGDVQMSTGNLVVGTSGKGIDFSATPGTGTSELFDDYEEGTFTPTLQGATTTTYTTQDGRYTIVGRQVFFQVELQINSLGNGSNNTFLLSGLPSNGSTFSTISVGFFATIATAVTSLFGYINSNSTAVTMQNIILANTASGTAATFGNGARVILSGQYSI